MEVKVHCAYDEMVDIDKLVPNHRNPNKHPKKQIELLAKIIKYQGWRVPITVSTRSGFIVRGHGRYEAAKLLGLEKVPVDYQDYANEAEEWADLIADNRIAELAEVDGKMLKDLIEEIDSGIIDLELTGYTEKEIEKLMTQYKQEEAQDDNFDVENALMQKPISEIGDIWLLGKHKLICGDATKEETYKALLEGKLADLIITDPPYNVDYEGKTKDRLKIVNDKMSDNNFYEFLLNAFQNMVNSLRAGSPVYVFHADTMGHYFRSAFVESGFYLAQVLIWVKNTIVLGRQDYKWKHEPILYGWKEGAAHSWYGGFDKPTTIEEDRPDLKKMTKEQLIEFIENLLGDRYPTTVIREDKPLRNDVHPTMKPVKLIGYLMSNSSKRGDIVLDPFAGSGSTLIAAEQLGRISYNIELDPKYCDVIVRRYIEFKKSDKDVFLLRGGEKIPYSELIADGKAQT